MAERPAAGRLATASIVGTTLEYYDFAVYNMLAALVFNRLFFPSFDPLSGTLLAFSTFAVGYLSRPVGGVIFGHLGDRYGRRFVLVATLLLMGITTALMGLLPTYTTAGIASPILLVVLRFIQGAALGGEWAGAVLLSVEHGDPQKRGRNASWAQMGPSLGTLLATGSIGLITLLLSPDEFLAWGWRLPFFASVVLVAFGLWIRVGVEETPLFKQIVQQRSKAQAPISEVVRGHWRSLLVGGGVRIGPDVLYSLSVAFSLSYMTTVLGLSRTLALTALSIGGAVNAFTIPLFGALSDRVGRRVVYGVGAVIGLIWMFAFFPLLATKQPVLIVLAIVVALTVHAMMYGPQAAFIAEQFPTRVRYAGASLAYTLAGIVGGGIAPMLSTALLQASGTTVAVSSYAAMALTITCIVLFVVRERAREPLD
ncbi:MFS transporter [Steroidobacter sp.]|uniref:MFS transporter n=1 Tax=Steroidobacter sp. TaxID=1978227 RepID=UPI001A5431F2|nr:MFS transporter [Steroidobacter sp.]MBL8267156.1 MHS family MFS transporter [Steroidobacter sp.]